MVKNKANKMGFLLFSLFVSPWFSTPPHFGLCASTENAATKIQAVFRGHKVRASMKQGDSSAASETTDSAQANAGSDPSKEELEAEFREDDKGIQFIFGHS